MPVRPILQEALSATSPDPVLRAVAIPVPEELFGTPEIAGIIQDMIDTLDREQDGVALAAPQIGISYRIFIVRYDRTIPPENGTATSAENSANQDSSVSPSALSSKTGIALQTKREPSIGVFINPRFVKSSRRRVEMDEGCLSVRGIYGTTLRHDRATIQACTADGKKFERGGGGLLAQIYQHETDHLDGILFIDHAVELVRVQKKETGAEEPEHVTPVD